MHYYCYEEKRFSDKSIEMIAKADNLIIEYNEQGYILTLRQLYYQFVSRGWIENTERSYKNLGNLVNDARVAGLLPWDGIEDRAREFKPWHIEEDPRKALDGIEFNFAVDLWAAQNTYIECWVEKEALGNVVERACTPFKVPYMSCKGYLSASQAWRAGERFKEAYEAGKNCVLLHLGDHDPSGIDMTRDNKDRIWLFSEESHVKVRRLALNSDQVQRYNPPPNPAKLSDSRATDYIRRFGDSSWELDALQPQVIEQIIENAIREEIRDPAQWNSSLREQTRQREILSRFRTEYDSIVEFLER